MKRIYDGALVANAASLAFNWIYNIPYLTRYAESGKEMLFQELNPEVYKEARRVYMAYPNMESGDVSFQGRLLELLVSLLKENPELTKEAYKDAVYQFIKPGSGYDGWVESYGKKLVVEQLSKELDQPNEQIYEDDQLVGMIPYIAVKSLGLPLEKAIELSYTFTSRSDYEQFYNWLEPIFNHPTDLKTDLANYIPYAPEAYRPSFIEATKDHDFIHYVKYNAGTACHMPHAMAVIIYILLHAKNFKDALEMNTRLGGASSDRGNIIGAIYSNYEEIPINWINLLKKRS